MKTCKPICQRNIIQPAIKRPISVEPWTLAVFIAMLSLVACRVWDNPRDPNGTNYQGFSTVKAVDDLEAHTPDGAKLMFQTFIRQRSAGCRCLSITDSRLKTALPHNSTTMTVFLDSNVMKVGHL